MPFTLGFDFTTLPTRRSLTASASWATQVLQ